MSPMKIAALVGATLATLIFAAPAQAATANANVNVRSGPGTDYRVVDVLRRGDRADIVRRSGGWCQVEKPGPDGWVSCRYLSDDRGGGGIVIGGGDRGPDVDIEFSIPGFSFSIGSGRGDFDFGRPDRPRRGEVCFYEHTDYRGSRFCARSGERIRALGAWNDRISSIRVRGNVEAQVCEHSNFRGRCVVVDRSVRNLGRRGNDVISSIRVR